MKRTKLLVTSMCALLTLGTIASCGTPAEDNKVSTLFEVTVEGNRTILAVGEKVQLSVTIFGTTSNEVTYASSDSEVLSVSEAGLCEAKQPGVGIITVQSVSNPDLKKEISLEVTKSLGQRNPQLQEMADSIESYNYGAGVRYDGEIKVDVGVGSAMGLLDLEDIHLPLQAEVQTTDVETNVHLRADVENLLTASGFGSSFVDVPLILRKTIGALFNKDFDNYLKDNDCKEYKYLDLYAFNNFDYYAAQTRNFGTAEVPDYRPFAIGKGNVVSLLSPLANSLTGLLGGGESSEGEEEGGLDIASLLTKDGLLRLTSTLYNFFDEDTGADYTKLSLGQEALGIINPLLSGIGGPIDLALGGISIEGWYLPSELTEVSLTVNNKAEGENKFSGLEFVVKGLNPDEEEYEFINISLKTPEILPADYMAKEKEKILNYNAASEMALTYGDKDTTSTVIDAIKVANTLADMQNTYGVAENKDITKTMGKLLSLYEHCDNDYVKDLLYPLSVRLSELKYGKEEILNGFVEKSSLVEGEARFIIDRFINKEKADFTAKFTSANPEIIEIDENTGVYKGLKQIYTGAISSGNKKSTSNSSKLTAVVTYKDGDKDASKTFNSTVKYEGETCGFASTKSTLVAKEGFDTTEHEISLPSNGIFTLKDVIKLPEGATDAKYTFTAKDKKIATVDSDGKVQALTPYMENNDGTMRTIAGITLKLTYKLGEESVTDNHVFFVKLTDTLSGKIDSTKATADVKIDEKANKITAKEGTTFDLNSIFLPSADKYDADSLKVNINKMDENLYDGTKFLSPYYSDYKLDEDGRLGVTNNISGKDYFADITYTVDGATKIERLYFSLEVIGEAKQPDDLVFEGIKDTHYNKETNTFTFNESEFTTIAIDGDKTIEKGYIIQLADGWTQSFISSSDIKTVYYKSGKIDGKTTYVLTGLQKGKVGASISIKKGSTSYKLYCYIEIK